MALNPPRSPSIVEDVDDEIVEAGGRSLKRPRFTRDQSAFLEAAFLEDQSLEPNRKRRLADSLSVSSRQVAIWFQNRRVRWRTKEKERSVEELEKMNQGMRASLGAMRAEFNALKRCYDTMAARNEVLEWQVKRLRECKSPDPSGSHSPLQPQKPLLLHIPPRHFSPGCFAAPHDAVHSKQTPSGLPPPLVLPTSPLQTPPATPPCSFYKHNMCLSGPTTPTMRSPVKVGAVTQDGTPALPSAEAQGVKSPGRIPAAAALQALQAFLLGEGHQPQVKEEMHDQGQQMNPTVASQPAGNPPPPSCPSPRSGSPRGKGGFFATWDCSAPEKSLPMMLNEQTQGATSLPAVGKECPKAASHLVSQGSCNGSVSSHSSGVQNLCSHNSGSFSDVLFGESASSLMMEIRSENREELLMLNGMGSTQLCRGKSCDAQKLWDDELAHWVS